MRVEVETLKSTNASLLGETRELKSALASYEQQLAAAKADLINKQSAAKSDLETMESALRACREARGMAESKVAAYEDLLLNKGVTRREMMGAWNDDGEIVSTARLMVPVRGGKRRRP